MCFVRGTAQCRIVRPFHGSRSYLSWAKNFSVPLVCVCVCVCVLRLQIFLLAYFNKDDKQIFAVQFVLFAFSCLRVRCRSWGWWLFNNCLKSLMLQPRSLCFRPSFVIVEYCVRMTLNLMVTSQFLRYGDSGVPLYSYYIQIYFDSGY